MWWAILVVTNNHPKIYLSTRQSGTIITHLKTSQCIRELMQPTLSGESLKHILVLNNKMPSEITELWVTAEEICDRLVHGVVWAWQLHWGGSTWGDLIHHLQNSLKINVGSFPCYWLFSQFWSIIGVELHLLKDAWEKYNVSNEEYIKHKTYNAESRRNKYALF